MATGEDYDDPFGKTLLDMWVARSDDGGAWVKQKKLSDTEIVATTGLFGTPMERTHAERMTLPVDAVIGVEKQEGRGGVLLAEDPQFGRVLWCPSYFTSSHAT